MAFGREAIVDDADGGGGGAAALVPDRRGSAGHNHDNDHDHDRMTATATRSHGSAVDTAVGMGLQELWNSKVACGVCASFLSNPEGRLTEPERREISECDAPVQTVSVRTATSTAGRLWPWRCVAPI